MKVIFASRDDCFYKKGGDTNQILLTKKYLEKKDVNIVVCENHSDMLEHLDADILHVFNIQTPSDIAPYVFLAKKHNIPVVLSPIYWDLWHAVIISKIKNLRIARFISNFKSFYRLFASICHRGYLSKQYVESRCEIINNVDFILPNSDEELVFLCKDLNLNYLDVKNKSTAVPNAIELEVSDIGYNGDLNVKNYVLSVGRIEPNKNQLSIVKAMMNTPEIPIVFVGRKGDDITYADDVMSLSNLRGNVYFFDEVPHEKIQMFYKNAKVHVLASFRESPGLVTLEALGQGCRVVVSGHDFCPVKYYKFEGNAYICNPYSIDSIRKNILSAISDVTPFSIGKDYFLYYSYNTSAKITYDIYNALAHPLKV
ncbi:glycosyltransferase family 4 protein [Aeromonas caviae]|uniref:glycosyltransferase family 4 protein n=1 Tax=Aeromonas caviae TaxID=648 RepID=UPI001CC6C349|nr:glycosyltransferase family 4 protein [Aeromonas caviae]GJB03938.1 glycosyl transferase [Aeromonas caviae]GKR44750.1 glycosyl transferase [Aeromonas caviae]GKR52911.1 glycosyl transferase [Aeromonas caviae]GKR62811.1 glycosyl transferase [Aeromonas caviae]GKR88998.1 glycosyl transferase [Aeromonas caviae]